MHNNNYFVLKKNSERKNCKDVFNAFLVKNAKYEGKYDFPIIKSYIEIPKRLISFSKCISSNDYDCWVHFYEDDWEFERIWRNPKKYIKILKRFKGVILPDFSLYRDMPLAMQIYNIYRSRAVGNYLQCNDIKVIPNIRFGDERTYELCCIGIETDSIISIGTHGTNSNMIDKSILVVGIDRVINILHPRIVIIYGSIPKYILNKYKDSNISFVSFSPSIKGENK